MSDSNEFREEIEKLREHIRSLTGAYERNRKELNRTRNQVNHVTRAAEKRLTEAANHIDTLHERIDFMVDSWQADIRQFVPGPVTMNTIDPESGQVVTKVVCDTRAEKLAQVEAFRPIEVGKAPVQPLPHEDHIVI